MDNLKGVLIFLVVFSHFLLHYVQEGVASLFVQTLTYYIFTFHMPLFVFVSGYFSKNVDKSRANAFESLLLPYLVFNSLMMLCEARVTGSMRHVSLLTPVYVHWFLLALFFWRILLKDLVKIRLILPISVFAAFMVGYFNDGTNILGIGRTIAFLPFFLLGYYADQSTIAKIRTTTRYLAVALLVVSAWPVYLLTASHSLSLSVFVAAPYSPTETLWLRLTFFALAFLMGLAVLVLCPAAKLKFLTSAGRFSLLVFLLHRYVSFLFYDLVPAEAWRSAHVLTVLAFSALTVWLLGNPIMAGAYSAVAACARNLLTTGRYRPSVDGKPVRDLLAALALFALPTVYVAFSDASKASENQGDVVHAVLDREQRRGIDSAATVSFVGDLILLENQVKRAWNDESQSFDLRPVFEYTRDYFQKADFSVGVLEVPLAGEEAGYSTSNFGDGIPLRLNGPDRWVQDIRGSGIDLVTTATNHAMDKGKAGLYRTLDVLDTIGLAHVGTGRNMAERNRILIRNVKGIRIAFLAYTYGANFCNHAYFDGDNAHLLTVLAPPENRREFAQSLKIVQHDIRRAMLHDPDVIIALPHMGEQFSHSSDRFSRVWAETLLVEGVDVVLAAHAHAVQPIEYHSIPTPDGGRRTGLIVYCPGNFVNESTEKDGDAAAIVNVHLDAAPEQRGRLLGVSLVPLWIQRRVAGQPRPVPVVAVGTNDVRYRDPTICTMTPDAFAHNLERIAAKIQAAQPDARIAFVNVWPAYDNDRFSRLPPERRDAMVAEYNRVLRDFCADGGYIFLDANQHIRAYLERHVTGDNILDHIHPNAGRGVRLYSNAVLFGPPARWAVE